MCIFLEILISAGVSIITACITTNIKYGKKIKESIREERKNVYSLLLDILFKIKDDPAIIFNYSKCIEPLNQIRVNVNLYASANVIREIEAIWTLIKLKFDNYSDLFSGPEYERYRENELDIMEKQKLICNMRKQIILNGKP